MEFEKDTSPVSDEQRRLAETKKLTLEPMHEHIAPDDIADSQIAAQHLAGPALQNAPNDMEQSKRVEAPEKSTLVSSPSASTTSSPIRTAAGIVVFLCVGVTAVILLMTNK